MVKPTNIINMFDMVHNKLSLLNYCHGQQKFLDIGKLIG